jgi:carbon storage regulator
MCGESIMLGDDIMVTVLRASHGKARIGIDAPKSLPCHRKEIYDRIKAEEAEREPPTD